MHFVVASTAAIHRFAGLLIIQLLPTETICRELQLLNWRLKRPKRLNSGKKRYLQLWFGRCRLHLQLQAHETGIHTIHDAARLKLCTNITFKWLGCSALLALVLLMLHDNGFWSPRLCIWLLSQVYLRHECTERGILTAPIVRTGCRKLFTRCGEG